MIQEKAKERVRILAFWERHGTAATEEAFKVKKRTLYRWKKKQREGLGKLEALNDGNRAPKKKRKRLWDYRTILELRRLRNEHQWVALYKHCKVMISVLMSKCWLCLKCFFLGDAGLFQRGRRFLDFLVIEERGGYC